MRESSPLVFVLFGIYSKIYERLSRREPANTGLGNNIIRRTLAPGAVDALVLFSGSHVINRHQVFYHT